MKLVLSFFLTVLVLIFSLQACTSRNESSSAEATAQPDTISGLLPDTAKVTGVSDGFDQIPMIGSIEDNKPSLQTPTSQKEELYNTITFKGKGAEERRKGIKLASSGDLKGAIAEFTKSIEVHERNPDAYFYRGKAKWELKDYAGAGVDFAKAIQIRPSQAPYYYYRGQMYLEQKRFQEALADFDTTLARVPDYYDAVNYKGVVLAAMGKHQEAIDRKSVV